MYAFKRWNIVQVKCYICATGRKTDITCWATLNASPPPQKKQKKVESLKLGLSWSNIDIWTS